MIDNYEKENTVCYKYARKSWCGNCLNCALKELPQEKFDIYIYVLMGQGGLVSNLPPYVKVINKKYCYKIRTFM